MNEELRARMIEILSGLMYDLVDIQLEGVSEEVDYYAIALSDLVIRLERGA